MQNNPPYRTVSNVSDTYQLLLNNLRNVRINHGFTQLEISSDLNISESAYRRIELGYSLLSMPRYLSICEILDIAPCKMLSDFTDQIDYEENRTQKPRNENILSELRRENHFLKSLLENYLEKLHDHILQNSLSAKG